MKHKIWLYLAVAFGASFGSVFLCNVLFDIGLSDLGGLLMMGMLTIGWPGTSAWLGYEAGKDLKRYWFLPVLFALTMPYFFPYYGAGWLAWAYAGGVLLFGLITMLCSRLTK